MSPRSVITLTLETVLHHDNHRHLLNEVLTRRAGRACLDALIVPTSRPVGWLVDAVNLARQLRCGLIAMCSGEVSAAEAAAVGTEAGVPVIAAEVAKLRWKLPEFSAARMIDNTEFARPSDTSPKRNLALLLARVAGWRTVLFLDDDIFDVTPDSVRAAAWLTGYYDAVGLRNRGFPDNSIVCHINRSLGARQSQFIGVGALAVSPQQTRSHFPNIYNQDWFFIIGHGRVHVAATGRMWQAACYPFDDPDRARREELGDCLAEGLYWLLDDGKPIEYADFNHWDDFLSRRALFIDNLISEVQMSSWAKERKDRVLDSLENARSTTEKIKPELCMEFLRRWRSDVITWQTFLESHEVRGGVDAALEYLAWPGVVKTEHAWPDVATCELLLEDRLKCWSGESLQPSATPNSAPARPPIPSQLPSGPAGG